MSSSLIVCRSEFKDRGLGLLFAEIKVPIALIALSAEHTEEQGLPQGSALPHTPVTCSLLPTTTGNSMVKCAKHVAGLFREVGRHRTEVPPGCPSPSGHWCSVTSVLLR